MEIKTYLADNNLSGHHKVYLETLLFIKNTEDISLLTQFEPNKKKLKFYKERRKFIFDILEKVKKKPFSGKKVVHFLYLDSLYTAPLFRKLYSKDIDVIATLHHMPQNYLKMKILKSFSKKINKIVVHSEYSKLQLEENGILNVEVVHYPSFYDYSKFPTKTELRKQFNIPEDKIVLSVLGGTRYDKGLDILLDSYKYVDENVKNKVLLNIVGKEETYTREFINNRIKEHSINARIELGYVEDEDFAKNVLVSDFIILPYRKVFTGNSGPMTEAIVNNIPVIGPDYNNLGYLIRKNNLGFVFKVEDTSSLAETIHRIVYTEKRSMSVDYSKKLNMKEFLTRYAYLYENIK